MKNELEVANQNLKTSLVIKFESEKTVEAVHTHVIDTIQGAIDFIIVLANKSLLRTLQVQMKCWTAQVDNALSKLAVSGNVATRMSFEEIREAEKLASKNDNSWTIGQEKVRS